MNKVWFITGASRGLGAVEKTLGPCAHLFAVPLDVTKHGAPEEAVKAAVAHLGRIDVVVNNAGYALYGALEECSEEEVERQLNTNLLGLLAVTRAVLPTLRAQKRATSSTCLPLRAFEAIRDPRATAGRSLRSKGSPSPSPLRPLRSASRSPSSSRASPERSS